MFAINVTNHRVHIVAEFIAPGPGPCAIDGSPTTWSCFFLSIATFTTTAAGHTTQDFSVLSSRSFHGFHFRFFFMSGPTVAQRQSHRREAGPSTAHHPRKNSTGIERRREPGYRRTPDYNDLSVFIVMADCNFRPLARGIEAQGCPFCF